MLHGSGAFAPDPAPRGYTGQETDSLRSTCCRSPEFPSASHLEDSGSLPPPLPHDGIPQHFVLGRFRHAPLRRLSSQPPTTTTGDSARNSTASRSAHRLALHLDPARFSPRPAYCLLARFPALLTKGRHLSGDLRSRAMPHPHPATPATNNHASPRPLRGRTLFIRTRFARPLRRVGAAFPKPGQPMAATPGCSQSQSLYAISYRLRGSR